MPLICQHRLCWWGGWMPLLILCAIWVILFVHSSHPEPGLEPVIFLVPQAPRCWGYGVRHTSSVITGVLNSLGVLFMCHCETDLDPKGKSLEMPLHGRHCFSLLWQELDAVSGRELGNQSSCLDFLLVEGFLVLFFNYLFTFCFVLLFWLWFLKTGFLCLALSVLELTL